jgi:acetylornithine deacetylase/succinyl-diaminopimelate desuccinylase-like protein
VPEDAGRIKADIEELVPEGCEMEEILNEAALLTDPGDATVLHLRNVTAEMTGRPVKLRGANGSSDARHFDCPGVELGPAGGDIGGDNEYVEIASLEEYYRVITSFLLGLS